MAQILDKLSRLAIPIGFSLAIGQASMYDVRGGSRAVIFDRFVGIKKEVIEEGTHFLIPWLQKAIIYDVRTRVFQFIIFFCFLSFN